MTQETFERELSRRADDVHGAPFTFEDVRGKAVSIRHRRRAALAGGVAAGKAFVDALTLHSHVANIGDVRSLVIHPASTTHSQLTPEQQAKSGVTPGLVRLAVGIEHIDDILADLDAGFRAAKDA